MQTRREILQQSLIAPLALGNRPGTEIVSGSDCLSQESAAGFRLLLRSAHAARGVTVICGTNLTPGLVDRVNQGAFVIHELGPDAAAFEASHGLFLRYSWPHTALVRTFLRFAPVHCGQDEVIATYAGQPVAMRRRMGRGGVIVLGSMLGPSLYARDREAHRLGAEMLARIGEVTG